jgi:hypothetical protein
VNPNCFPEHVCHVDCLRAAILTVYCTQFAMQTAIRIQKHRIRKIRILFRADLSLPGPYKSSGRYTNIVGRFSSNIHLSDVRILFGIS